MAKAKIKVIIKHPGSKPYSAWISPTLENLQKHVGGYIEELSIANDAAILCDEEGRINGAEYNCEVHGNPFYGPIIFVGTDGDSFSDFPMEWQAFKKMFRNMF